MRTVVLAAALTAVLSAAPVAHAEPFVVGSGTLPAVAVDTAGTAYLAFNGLEAGSPPHFCRLPRGATACDVALTLPIAASTDTTSRPFVHVSGDRVDILAYRYGPQTAILRYTSTNRGVTFGAAQVAGGNVPFVEATAGPGDSVTVATNADFRGGLVQNVPLSGAVPNTFATLFDGTRPYNGTVGLDGAAPVAVFATGSSVAAFRRSTGTGSINDAANWSAPLDIGYADYPRLAGGPTGLYLLAGDADDGLFVRRFEGATFGAPVILTDDGDASEMHLFEDAAGRLHAVYPWLAADGWVAEHAVSDDGETWESGELAFQTDDEPTAMRAATAPDHIGVAVWTSRVPGVTQVRMAAIGPGAPATEQPPPTLTPTPTPTRTPTPTPTPTPPRTPPAADPVPDFERTVVVRAVSGTIRVRLPGTSRFVNLGAVNEILLGSTIDAKRGVLDLQSVPSPTAAPQTVRLSQGMFRVTQRRGITDFKLNEPLARCSRRARTAAKKPKTRKLWGDGRGAFRTTGSFSAATVRGTKWLVQDSCAGTLTRVVQGAVTVRDGRRTVIVRAGKRYLARARR